MYNFFKFELSDEEKAEINRIQNLIINKKIPFTYPDYMLNSFNSFSLRDIIIQQMGFTLLSYDWINYLIEFLKGKKCLEVMSGTGSLSSVLKEQNIDIIATDDFSWSINNEISAFNNYWIDIENIDATQAVKKYGKDIDIIIMSWPYMDNNASSVLETMRKENPNCQLIYIGEGNGGCTANEEFFKNSNNVKNKLIDNMNKNFKSWMGIHDKIYLLK